MSQTIAPASVHCALLVQPGPHVPAVTPARRQKGPAADVVQSEFVRHATQAFVAVSHRGIAEPAQSLSAVHTTHSCVVGLHTRLAAGQSVPPTRQPTHAPEVVSQMGVIPTHAGPPSTLHEARHVCVAG
jgi:hypothetical protein